MTRRTEGKFFSGDNFLMEGSKTSSWGILLRGSYVIEKIAKGYAVRIDRKQINPQDKRQLSLNSQKCIAA
jgi:hypothetical protein